MPTERYFTAAEVAARIGIAAKTLANWRCSEPHSGPRYRRYGRKILYPETALIEWEQSNEFSSTKEYLGKRGGGPATAYATAIEQVQARIDELKRDLVAAEEEMFKLLASPATKVPRRRRKR